MTDWAEFHQQCSAIKGDPPLALAATAKPVPRVIIEVSGGCVTRVNASAPVDVAVLDWDNVARTPETEDERREAAEAKALEQEAEALRETVW